MRPGWAVVALASLLALGADKDTDAVPKEVRDLVGTYRGAWTLYGLDDKGEVVRRAGWTDVVKAEGPKVERDKAFVTMTDTMTFEGGKTATFQAREGYVLKDGAASDYFIESGGQFKRMVKVGDGVWSYALPATPAELAQLGFPEGATGQHALVKVVTKEKGVETHRISRLTTVSYKDKDGKEHALQFVSLKGYHKREP
jgi:hypothetical protein